MKQTAPILEMTNICKAFPTVVALQNVSIALYAGEIHALMGENGAGKSTLMKIAAGAVEADSGTIRVNQQSTPIRSPLAARAAGINLLYQEPNLVPQLTVAENVFMGCEPKRGFLTDIKRMNIEAEIMLKRLQASFSSDRKVWQLSIAERQIVEIAKALLLGGQVLLLDEPTAALSNFETATFFEIITQLRQEGIAILYASHRMSEVYALADRVTVLRNGEHVAELKRDDINSKTIVQMMVGRDLELPKRQVKPLDQPNTLEVRNLTDGVLLEPISFCLQQHEILGLAGVVGAGRSQLVNLLYGVERSTHGQIRLNNQAVRIKSPKDAIAVGMALVGKNNTEQSMFTSLNAEENVVMPILTQHSQYGFLKLKALHQTFLKTTNAMQINTNAQATQHLSTGTQQKLLIARALIQQPQVLMLNDPCKGVDIAAKHEIEHFLLELSSQGMAIILISSEFADLERLCDRVLVLRQGAIVAELKDQQIVQSEMVAYATGAKQADDVF